MPLTVFHRCDAHRPAPARNSHATCRRQSDCQGARVRPSRLSACGFTHRNKAPRPSAGCHAPKTINNGRPVSYLLQALLSRVAFLAFQALLTRLEVNVIDFYLAVQPLGYRLLVDRLLNAVHHTQRGRIADRYRCKRWTLGTSPLVISAYSRDMT